METLGVKISTYHPMPSQKLLVAPDPSHNSFLSLLSHDTYTAVIDQVESWFKPLNVQVMLWLPLSTSSLFQFLVPHYQDTPLLPKDSIHILYIHLFPPNCCKYSPNSPLSSVSTSTIMSIPSCCILLLTKFLLVSMLSPLTFHESIFSFMIHVMLHFSLYSLFHS